MRSGCPAPELAWEPAARACARGLRFAPPVLDEGVLRRLPALLRGDAGGPAHARDGAARRWRTARRRARRGLSARDSARRRRRAHARAPAGTGPRPPRRARGAARPASASSMRRGAAAGAARSAACRPSSASSGKPKTEARHASRVRASAIRRVAPRRPAPPSRTPRCPTRAARRGACARRSRRRRTPARRGRRARARVVQLAQSPQHEARLREGEPTRRRTAAGRRRAPGTRPRPRRCGRRRAPGRRPASTSSSAPCTSTLRASSVAMPGARAQSSSVVSSILSVRSGSWRHSSGWRPIAAGSARTARSSAGRA